MKSEIGTLAPVIMTFDLFVTEKHRGFYQVPEDLASVSHAGFESLKWPIYCNEKCKTTSIDSRSAYERANGVFLKANT